MRIELQRIIRMTMFLLYFRLMKKFDTDVHVTSQPTERLISSGILTSGQPHRNHLRTNDTLKIRLHQLKTEVTKSHICLIHCYNLEKGTISLSVNAQSHMFWYLWEHASNP